MLEQQGTTKNHGRVVRGTSFTAEAIFRTADCVGIQVTRLGFDASGERRFRVQGGTSLMGRVFFIKENTVEIAMNIAHFQMPTESADCTSCCRSVARQSRFRKGTSL